MSVCKCGFSDYAEGQPDNYKCRQCRIWNPDPAPVTPIPKAETTMIWVGDIRERPRDFNHKSKLNNFAGCTCGKRWSHRCCTCCNEFHHDPKCSAGTGDIG